MWLRMNDSPVPVQTTFASLPATAKDPIDDSSHVIKVRLARDSGDRGSAIPDWSDVAKLQLAVNFRIRLRLLGPNK